MSARSAGDDVRRTATPDLARLGSIVVGSDFSRDSERALERAAMVASERDSALTIVHVAPTVPRDLLRRLTGRAVPPEKERLGSAIEDLRARGVRASGSFVEGRAVSGLVDAARRRQADLLVVGARGRAIADEVLGSTAERAVAVGRCPVLVVRAPVAPYRRVLVAGALDRSFGVVLSAARDFVPSAVVHLVHVYEVPFASTFVLAGVDAQAIAAHRRVVRGEARAALDRLLAHSPARPQAVILQHGDPRTEVARRVQKGGYDLVVLARSRSRAHRWLFGSVTRSVLRDAKADVLLV